MDEWEYHALECPACFAVMFGRHRIRLCDRGAKLAARWARK